MSTTHLLTEIQQRSQNTGEREFGYAKGKVWMAPDFDAPLDDFADYQ